MAMNRHKANQILDLASKLLVAAQTGAASNPDNWSAGVEAMASEAGYGTYDRQTGSIVVGGDLYEVTGLYVYDDGQVEYPSYGSGGVSNAIKSITGRTDGILVEGQ